MFAAFCAAETQEEKKLLLALRLLRAVADGVLLSSIGGVSGTVMELDNLLGPRREAESDRIRRCVIMFPEGLTITLLFNTLGLPLRASWVSCDDRSWRGELGEGGVTVVIGITSGLGGGVIGRLSTSTTGGEGETGLVADFCNGLGDRCLAVSEDSRPCLVSSLFWKISSVRTGLLKALEDG